MNTGECPVLLLKLSLCERHVNDDLVWLLVFLPIVWDHCVCMCRLVERAAKMAGNVTRVV